jgi:hypothetical protein
MAKRSDLPRFCSDWCEQELAFVEVYSPAKGGGWEMIKRVEKKKKKEKWEAGALLRAIEDTIDANSRYQLRAKNGANETLDRGTKIIQAEGAPVHDKRDISHIQGDSVAVQVDSLAWGLIEAQARSLDFAETVLEQTVGLMGESVEARITSEAEAAAAHADAVIERERQRWRPEDWLAVLSGLGEIALPMVPTLKKGLGKIGDMLKALRRAKAEGGDG